MARTKDPKYNHNFPLIHDKDFLALSPQKQKFIYLYYLKPINGWNNARIYKTAFNRKDIKDMSAWVETSNLLKSPKIVPLLKRITEHRVEQLNITTERILAEESYIAFSDFSDLFDDDGLSIVNPKEMPLEIRKAIKSVEEVRVGLETRYRVTLWSKSEALKRLQAITGMRPAKKLEVTGKDGQPLSMTHTLTHKIDLSGLSNDELKVLEKLVNRHTKGDNPDE